MDLETKLVTPRDQVEKVLMDRFSGKLHALTPDAMPDINTHKNGDYGFSYLGLALYANGHNILSKSSNYPNGLYYKDQDAIFGVGVFFRPDKPVTPCLHIIAPRGPNWQKAVNAFASQVLELMPEAQLFVRQLTFEQYKTLKPQPNLERLLGREPQSPWHAAEANPWVSRETGSNGSLKRTYAPQEDETYNHAMIDMDKVITRPEEGMFANIPWLASANERNMKRRNYNGFSNFLKRNELEFSLEEFGPERANEARALVQSHFRHLAESGKAIGSTAADYESIIASNAEELHAAGVKMYIGYVQKPGQAKVPVSFFAVEKLGHDIAGGYGTITSYDSKPFEGIVTDFTGFNNIATYAMGQLMHRLKSEGIRYFNMGGSETPELDTGKARLGAQPRDTYWAAANTPEDQRNWHRV